MSSQGPFGGGGSPMQGLGGSASPGLTGLNNPLVNQGVLPTQQPNKPFGTPTPGFSGIGQGGRNPFSPGPQGGFGYMPGPPQNLPAPGVLQSYNPSGFQMPPMQMPQQPGFGFPGGMGGSNGYMQPIMPRYLNE